MFANGRVGNELYHGFVVLMYIMHAELPHVAAWQRRHSKSFHQSIERTLSLHGACSFMKYCMLRRVCESAVHMCDTFCDVWLLVLG